MDISVYEEMYSIEKNHWWFNAKRKIILYILEDMVKRLGFDNKAVRICDMGCGCGGTLEELRRNYNASGMDAVNTAIIFCKNRGLEVQKGELPDRLPYKEGEFDIILLLDVIEHIEDDFEAIRETFSILKPGGIIICTAPAYQWLWTDHDRIHHHKRRYSKRRFCRLFAIPEVSIIICSYYNTFLFPLALIQRIYSKLFFKKQTKAETFIPPRFLNSILEKIFSFERFFIKRFTFPFGLSLISVARKGP